MDRNKALQKALACIDGDFIKALAEPARIEILKLLILDGACDVNTLAAKLPQDRSVISRHLKVMENAGLLSRQKTGRHVIYAADGETSLQKSEQLVGVMRQCMDLGCC